MVSLKRCMFDFVWLRSGNEVINCAKGCEQDSTDVGEPLWNSVLDDTAHADAVHGGLVIWGTRQHSGRTESKESSKRAASRVTGSTVMKEELSPPECTKIARFGFSAAAAAIFTAPLHNGATLWAPRCEITLRSKIASERRISLRWKRAKLIPTAGILAIAESAVKIASEWRCAIWVHSVHHQIRQSGASAPAQSRSSRKAFGRCPKGSIGRNNTNAGRITVRQANTGKTLHREDPPLELQWTTRFSSHCIKIGSSSS